PADGPLPDADIADNVKQEDRRENLGDRAERACVHGRASSASDGGKTTDGAFGSGRLATGCAGDGDAAGGLCVNWLKRSIRGPSEFDKMVWNDGAILPIRR